VGVVWSTSDDTDGLFECKASLATLHTINLSLNQWRSSFISFIGTQTLVAIDFHETRKAFTHSHTSLLMHSFQLRSTFQLTVPVSPHDVNSWPKTFFPGNSPMCLWTLTYDLDHVYVCFCWVRFSFFSTVPRWSGAQPNSQCVCLC